MSFRYLLAAALVALLALPAAAQTSGLDRLTLRGDLLGWEAVGRLDLPSGYCTGVLIASDTVLTAAHCLYDDRRSEWIDPRTITFRAGLRDGDSIADRSGARAVAHARYVPTAWNTEVSIRHDVALLELSNPIPAATAAPFRVQSPSRVSRQVSLVSYGRGRSDALSRQRVCEVLGRQGGLLAFDCDAERGSSGAPVFDLSGNRARIVSIISGGSRMRGTEISLGMELPSVVGDLQRAMRSGNGVWPREEVGSRRLRVGESPDRGEEGAGVRFLRP